ncbi:dihydrofolate reductase, partial [Oerskovia sp. Sa2CUA8]|nr:dihydrofolate reductase [Oerskovia gallyi]
LAAAGILPRQEVTITPEAGSYTVSAPDAETVLDLPDDVARHLFVTAP